MAKQKLGILSSYNELCGNASYTKALAEGLSKHFDQTVISLNVELLRKGESKSAKLHIKKICGELSKFDCVNIQFEAGLFGSHPKHIFKRFLKVTRSCKKILLTMHRFDPTKKYPGLTSLGKCLLKAAIKPYYQECIQTYATNRYATLYAKVIEFCRKNNIPILVHTQRDKELIKMKFDYEEIYDHPLSFYDQEYIDSVNRSFSRKDFCEKLLLNESKTYIGIFGFVSKYKGHETVIKAMTFLPENYELLIFGGQHPHTIIMNEDVNAYIKELMDLVKQLKLTNRVKFYGLLDDDTFLKALLRCDFNVLPYLEVNQGGSAIASLSLETNSNTIFSQNLAFFELAKYAPNSFRLVTIGNHLELANAIKSYRKTEFEKNLKAYHNQYNINTSTVLYHKLLTRV